MGFTSLWTLPCALISISAARWLKGRSRTWVLLAASVTFYSALDPIALLSVAAVVLASWAGTVALARRPSFAALGLSIAATLTPLFAAKYWPWLRVGLASGDWWSSADLDSRGVPPGLSFVALQATGCVVDTWRRRISPTSLRDHALFLAFFPQLVAGPIERAERLRPQLENPEVPDALHLYRASKLLLWGYALKLCVADAIAGPIERWLHLPSAEAPAGLALALPMFSARLYLDFYAYTCIAIAFGMAHGVRLTQNFANPYGAPSLTWFWRRWHISLSSWFRDYVYVPLGGQSRGAARAVAAVLTVFLLSGLWHGAGLGFLLWGLAHGTGLLVERFGQRASAHVTFRLSPTKQRVLRGLGVILTFSFVSICWIPFLADREHPVPLLIERLGMIVQDLQDTVTALGRQLADEAWLICLAMFVTATAHRMESWYWSRAPRSRSGVTADLVVTNALVICLLLFGDLGGRTFIYFAF